MGITVSLNLDGIQTMQVGGAPPAGAYRVTVDKVEQAAKKSGQGFNVVITQRVVEGAAAGSTVRQWLPIPDNSGSDADKFVRSKWRRLLLSLGYPESGLAGQLTFEAEELMTKNSVVFVRDDPPTPDGKRQIEIIDVLPTDAENALAGNWNPGGGKAAATPQAAAVGQALGAPAPAAPTTLGAAPALQQAPAGQQQATLGAAPAAQPGNTAPAQGGLAGMFPQGS